MSELAIYRTILWTWLVSSVVIFVVLLFRTAPYGRHARGGWGPLIPPRLGWLLMEAPAALVIAVLAVPSLLRDGYPQGWLLLGLWELHYLNRAFIFPLRIRSTRKMPISVVGMAVFFNAVNGWLNARGLTSFGPELGRVALTDPRVLAGVTLFLVGLYVNWDADARLIALRHDGGEYAIPRGGLYELISCPNYFGEMIEWLGFAIAAGSLAALSFFAWSVANLAPRALAHHRWYKEHFPDYPAQRRAVVPFLW